jgi:hypothetical protein
VRTDPFTWQLVDEYDWQDSGEKWVEIGDSKIKDKYAAIVEREGNAAPFHVSAKTGARLDTYELRSSPPTKPQKN